MPEVSLEPLAMEEAIAFWKDKIRLSKKDFYALSDAARTRAFAVSGIAKGDELEAIYNAISKAIEQGTTLAKFKRDCAAIFEKQGWVGKRARRMEIIFRTNIQTAYNVGRYQKQKERTKHFPYLQYQAVNDSRTRPAHLAMNGRVFPFEHEVWDTWYPPNGFNCRCSTRLLSRGQVRRLGLKVEEDNPNYKLVEPPDPKTGSTLPARTLMPDVGWSYHPGKTVWGGIVEDVGTPESWKFKPLPGLYKPQNYGQPLLKELKDNEVPDLPKGLVPLPSGLQESEYYKEFTDRFGEHTTLVDKLGDALELTLRSFLVNKDAKPGEEEWKFTKKGHGEIIPLIKWIVANPFEIWLTPQSDKSGKIRLSRRYISVWQAKSANRETGFLVFEVVKGQLVGVTAFAPARKGKPDYAYMEKLREGILLHPKKTVISGLDTGEKK